METREVSGACAGCRGAGQVERGHFTCDVGTVERLTALGWVLVGEVLEEGSWVATVERDDSANAGRPTGPASQRVFRRADGTEDLSVRPGERSLCFDGNWRTDFQG